MKNQHKNILHWVLLGAFLALSSAFVYENANELKVSILPTAIAPAFDGLTPPVAKSPRWTALLAAEYKLPYEKIPASKLADLPYYDPNQLKTPVESLGWKASSDLAIRDAKITYSTPYMSDYKLNGREYTGSHPAVDIKVPANTPVVAIGNGIAVKVANQSTGFGVHVVIRHDNFPSFDNPNILTTYYSSYSHLGLAMVSEGAVVLKGQQVGLSGATGEATTPHVHFEIDYGPWHPYWPFTYQEANAAGLTFWEAVNAGLGKEKALATTINPMVYVQKYRNLGGVSGNVAVTNVVTPPPITPVTNPVVIPPQVNTNTDPVTVPVVPTPVVTPPVLQTTIQPATAFQVISDAGFQVGNPLNITVLAVDSSGKVVTNYKSPSGVQLSLAFGGATIEKSYYTTEEFQQGKAVTKITPTADLGLQIKATDGVISGFSQIMQSRQFTDVELASELNVALSFLKRYNIVVGFPDGRFKPNDVVNRVEALKFILEGTNKDLVISGKLPFKDVNGKGKVWYDKYVLTGFQGGIVAGYLDLTFRPINTVSKVEFIKMLLTALDVPLETNLTEDVYSDVAKDSWPAPYVKYVKDKRLIDTYGNNFNPSQGMTREAVAKLIYRTIMLRISGADQYTPNMSVSVDKSNVFFGINS